MRAVLGRLAVLAGLVVAAQLWIGASRVPKVVRRLEAALPEGVDVVFFSDSTNTAHAVDDEDLRTIAQMLQDRLADRRVLALDHGAYHAGVYLDFCQYMADQGVCPRVVIAPINLRSLQPIWSERPGWQFEREHFILRHPRWRALLDPARVFGLFRFPSDAAERFAALTVTLDGERLGTLEQLMPDEFAATSRDEKTRAMILQYVLPVDVESRRWQQWRELVRLVQRQGWPLVLYIAPVDVETGAALLPGKMRQAVAANVRLLKEELAELGAPVLDLSDALGAADFAWVGAPNEHLGAAGRAFVAEQLAAAIARVAQSPRGDRPRDGAASGRQR